MGHASSFNLSIVLALCLGSLTFGYNFSVIANTLGQQNFYTYFGLSQDPTDPEYKFTNEILGALNGLFSAGGIFGSLLVGWIAEAKGRKLTLIVAMIVSLIGSALCAGSVHIAMFLVARFLTGFGVGMLATLIPIFQSELVPPSSRGFLVGQHGFILVMGYCIAGWIGYGTNYSSNGSFQWRFPMALAVLWPALLIIVIPYIPESPRWLLNQGRSEEAWSIVSRLHRTNDDPDETFARQEFHQMSAQIETDRNAASSDQGMLSLLKNPHHRKRLLVAGLTMFTAQASGNLVVYNYSVIIYQDLGFTGNIPLLITSLYTTYAAILNFTNAALLDRVGRVRLMVIGYIGCIACLAIESALVAQFTGTTNTAGLRATVFILFLFLTCYAGCCDANIFVYCAEIWPTHLRPMGMAYSMSIFFLSTMPFQIPAPTAFASIGWKYYMLFIGLTVVNVAIIAWKFPETRGLALEEINALFGEEVAVNLTHLSTEAKGELDKKAAKDPESTFRQEEKVEKVA